MFGYHDVPDCPFDIWSPVKTNNAVENRAFSPYCKHTQECEDIVQSIRRGIYSFELDDDFSQSDLDYIKKRLKDYGIFYVNLKLY